MHQASAKLKQRLPLGATTWAAVAASMLLGACSTAGIVSLAASAVGTGMEAAGFKSPSREAQARQIRIALNAARSLNTTDDGRSLALLIKVYQLRSAQSFSTVEAADLLDPDQERKALGEDLLSVRELTLTPGTSLDLTESLIAGTNVIAVAALFRAPAAKRWRYSFDARASIDTGISLGFHRCAMTVGSGALTGTDTGPDAISLAGVRCSVASDKPLRALSSSLPVSG